MAQWFPDAGQALQQLQETTHRGRSWRSEQARQKLLEGRQLINERRMMSHQDQVRIPIISGTGGRNQGALFQKLDNDGIWKKVMGFLIDPSDVTSAYFSCEMFRKNLEEKRRDMLLPKVFRVLRDTGHLEYFGFRHDDSRKMSASQKEESRQILRLRLVSKAWKAAAEGAFLSEPLDSSKPIWHPDTWNWKSPVVCEFKSMEDVDGAIAKLKNPRSCAPLLRLVSVRDPWLKRATERESFYFKLVHFLNAHGKSIWGLRIFLYTFKKLPAIFQGFDYDYEELCRIVSRLPQLKALFVVDYRTEWVSTWRPAFPRVPTLELCHFLQLQILDGWFVAQVLSRNESVKAVELRMGGCHELRVIPHIVWDALQPLQLQYFAFTFDQFVGKRQHFIETLDRLEQQVNWPLKHLQICYTHGIPLLRSFHISICEILTALRPFNETLEEFRLLSMQPFVMNDGIFLNDLVDFPKLKNIYLPLV